MHSRASRAARGWIVGSFATGVAALGHGLADGVAPSALAVVAGLVFAGVLGTLLIGRRPSLPRLAAIVAGAQLAFHLGFSGLTPGSAVPAPHHGVPLLLEPAVAHHGADPAMWIAHALAGLATLLFVTRAERALWGLLRDALAAATGTRTPAIAALPARMPAVAAAAPRHPLLASLRSVVSRRGPPSLATVPLTPLNDERERWNTPLPRACARSAPA